MCRQGAAPARFGRALAQNFGDRYVVYYDHGDPEEHDNVAACKAFYGTPREGVRNVNRLADVDALIADARGRTLILIEIEERPSSPKKIVGDIFALAMSNHVAVGRGDQEYFTIGACTQVVVAGVLLDKGSSCEKMEAIIAARLSSFQRPEHELSLRNVRLVFRESLTAALREAFSLVEAALFEPELVE